MPDYTPFYASFWWFKICVTAAVLLAGAHLVAEEDPPRPVQQGVDLHGDPLPPGAVSRLGTVRYRTDLGVFLGDNRTMLSTQGQFLIWLDVISGKIARVVDLEAGGVRILATTSDRATAAVRTYYYREEDQIGEHQIVMIDTATGEIRGRLPRRTTRQLSAPTSAAFSPDATHLATGAADGKGQVRVWNIETGQEVAMQTAPAFAQFPRATNEGIQSLAFSSDGKWLVVASNRDIARWQWQTDQPMEQLGPTDQFRSLAYSPATGRVAVAGPPVATVNNPGPTIRLFNVDSGRLEQEIIVPNQETLATDQIAFTSDGSQLISPLLSGGLSVWNARTGKLERTFSLHSHGITTQSRGVTLSPDDRWVATAHAGEVAVWDFGTGERLGDEPLGHLWKVRTIAVSPDGEEILTSAGEGLAVAWERATGRPIHVWRNPRSDETPIQGETFWASIYSADGKWIATTSREEMVLRSRETGEVVKTWPGSEDPYDGWYTALRFSADSRTLICFGSDWFLRVLDLQTGEIVSKHPIRPTDLPLKEDAEGSVEPEILRIGSLTGHAPSPLKSQAITDDGRRLVLATAKKVYLFDVATGQQRASYDLGQEDLQLLQEALKGEDADWVESELAQLISYTTVSPDAQRLATLGVREATQRTRKFELRIRGLESGELITSISLDGGPLGPYSSPVSAMAFSPDSTKIAVARRGGDSGTIDLYDLATGRRVARIERLGYWISLSDVLAFTPDGKQIVAPQTDTTVLVWDWRRFLVEEGL